MASSLVLFLFGHGVETSNLGDVSAQKLCQASGVFSLEQVGIDVSAPCRHDSNSIDVYTATHARGSRKVQEDRWRSLCVVCCLLAMFRNESDCFLIFQSHFGNPQISPFKFLSCSPCWSKKQDAGKDTSNAKRIFSDNVTCFCKNTSCSNRSHLSGCFKCSCTAFNLCSN